MYPGERRYLNTSSKATLPETTMGYLTLKYEKWLDEQSVMVGSYVTCLKKMHSKKKCSVFAIHLFLSIYLIGKFFGYVN